MILLFSIPFQLDQQQQHFIYHYFPIIASFLPLCSAIVVPFVVHTRKEERKKAEFDKSLEQFSFNVNVYRNKRRQQQKERKRELCSRP
jgi:hypothetical protein